MGTALYITLDKALKKGETTDVVIQYSTTSSCSALGWLTAQQTGSGKFPFLYSQNQAIHCRSLLRALHLPLAPVSV